MTQEDFKSKINKSFELFKNGRKLKNKQLELTLFDTKNGSTWGIDKSGDKYKYWEFVRENAATFTLNSSKKQRFTKAEIAQIKSLIAKDWLLTIRTVDEYQLYSSIHLVQPNSHLLTLQYEPIPKGVPIQY